MSSLITNIRQLVNVREDNHPLYGKQLRELPVIDNAYIRIENDTIAEIGSMDKLGRQRRSEKSELNAAGKFVLPGWCDSHTHLVFAGSREEEFVMKLSGSSYEEIAAKGGGILNSAKKLNETTEDELFNQACKRLEEVSKLGTTAIEIKSGYGLTVDGELKMLRVIKKLKSRSRLLIKSTFL